MTETNGSTAELVPAGWAAVAPVLDDVIARWHALGNGPEDWEAARAALPPAHTSGWTAVVERLQLINTFQWHEEDKSRAHGAGDAVLAAVKRSIDASNRRRVQCVDELDDLLYTGLSAGAAAGAPLNSESPGSIIDRLTVLALKVWHVKEALDGEDAEAMRGRLAGLEEQRDDLGGCLDALLAGIREGRIGLKLYRQVKVYREPDGTLRTDLD